jgi:hypothetical protein
MVESRKSQNTQNQRCVRHTEPKRMLAHGL